MKRCIVLTMILSSTLALAADWKPAPAPLMTRFAKDVNPDKPLPEYPRPQMVRKQWQSLNGLWQFTADNNLSGQILVPFCIESALSGVGKQSEHISYRRSFQIPDYWAGAHILLHFGAVDYHAVVKINGKEVGEHTGGYDSFTFEITNALKNEGEQQIVVDVTDSTADSQPRGKQTTHPAGIMYTPCTGIWQTVWLEPVPILSTIHNVVIHPDIDAGGVRVDVDYFERWEGHQEPTIEVLDGDKVVATGRDKELIKIANPKLWSPDNPFLYRLRIHTRDDAIESYFGMRKIDVSPDDKGTPRIKLNGKPILMVGPLDQGFWPDGIYTAPTDDALRSDIEMEKKLGFNCLRKHVKVEPQRFYYWCDKLGILVWQDMPSTFLKAPDPTAQKQFESELTQLVKQHINSPSIIMWVPINEGWGQAAYGTEGTKHLVDLIKSLDPSRLVNNSSGWTDCGTGDLHDIHSYPGPAAPPIEKSRAVVLGEFGGLGLGVDGHTWSAKSWGYQGMQSQQELSERYERLLGRLWDMSEKNGLCAGIYTQTTDVETECNGLMTYDREVLKVDADRVRLANQGKGPRVQVEMLIPTAREKPAEWRYTTDKPADGWESPQFDDSKWSKGQSGFGTAGTPGATIGTTWNASDIWLRREFDIPADAVKDAEFLVHHDEDCDIYINGVHAARMRGFTTDYVEQPFRGDGRNALKPGKNMIAAHCHQTVGGQYFDLGFARLVEKKD